ncbi:MAG: hypothetical protein F6K28_06760 [Microcoleus sp. SIO2G3]|nr:hypothetical protein [Microcoleus sp. SIO2G3]
MAIFETDMAFARLITTIIEMISLSSQNMFLGQHPITITQNFAHSVPIPDLTQSQYDKLSANNKSVNKAHASFLKSRQEFSQQMSEIIQLQLACAENLLT